MFFDNGLLVAGPHVDIKTQHLNMQKKYFGFLFVHHAFEIFNPQTKRPPAFNDVYFLGFPKSDVLLKALIGFQYHTQNFSPSENQLYKIIFPTYHLEGAKNQHRNHNAQSFLLFTQKWIFQGTALKQSRQRVKNHNRSRGNMCISISRIQQPL